MLRDSPPIILASTSPRRRELITLFGLAFQFISTDVDETPCANESPKALVRRLSGIKTELGTREFPNAIVIGADTIVLLDGMILGKPRDAEDATRMLTLLRKRAHVVYSGVTVMLGAQIATQIATTTVWMRDYSDAEIAAYVSSSDPLDKAAAYAIQHNGLRPVARIDGCQANVMGLPLCHLYCALKAFQVPIVEPDRACQAYLNIVCPVAREILESDHGQE